MSQQEHLHRLTHFYEALTPQSLADIEQLYAADAYFKDPFNEVHGTTAIRAIFSHMFQHVQAPRFAIKHRQMHGNEAFIVWDFYFRMKPASPPLCIHGASHLRFDSNGKVTYHRDYWDAAEELYEKLPVLGGLMRFLKRQVSR